MISVENIVSTQFPTLSDKHSRISGWLTRWLKMLFHESEFKQFEQQYPHLKGFDFIDQVLDYFDFQYSVSARQLEHIPTHGPCVIVANHPIGSLDGLALLQLVGSVRRDVKVVANELLLAVPPLHSLLLPVNAMGKRTAQDNIKAIDAHLQQGRALIIFPSGEVSRMGPTGLKDGAWHSGFIKFARRVQAPIVPIFIDGKNSALFYGVSLLAKPLSTLLLVHEMFRQRQVSVTIKIGAAVPFDLYQQLGLNKNATAKLFKKHVYRIGRNKTSPCFAADCATVAHPEPRVQLRQAIKDCERLGATSDGKEIYLFHYAGDSTVMRELGRLREVSFRAVGEGTGQRRDIDRFDAFYDHIVLWDDEQLELVGAYRLTRVQALRAQSGNPGLYSATLFDYSLQAEAYMQQGVELGRSFVQPNYWGMRSLDYLWYGIGAYLRKYPECRYLFGPVSISGALPRSAREKLVAFYGTHFPAAESWAVAKQLFDVGEDAAEYYSGADYHSEFAQLKAELALLDANVPTLYKQYSDIAEPGGVQFVAFNVDPEFADCVDGLVCVDMHYLKEKKRQRYLAAA